ASAVGARSEDELALGPEAVGQPRHERRLGPDHEQVGVDLFGPGGDRSGDPWVPGRGHDVGRASQDVGQRVLPAAPADDADLHDSEAWRSANWTNCSRPGPTPTSLIGTPACRDRNSTYALAAEGSSCSSVARDRSVFHPGRVSYTGVTLCRTDWWYGRLS